MPRHLPVIDCVTDVRAADILCGMKKRTNMPREDLPYCECPWLENAARDPECSIEFDAELNEYHLKHGKGYLMIYHCPFCAGRAPKSLRGEMFATVSSDEAARLHLLTKDMKTEKDVRAGLGEPTHVHEVGAMMQERNVGQKAGKVRVCKALHYDSHSETARINVNVGRHGKVSIHFTGKYIGKPGAKKP